MEPPPMLETNVDGRTVTDGAVPGRPARARPAVATPFRLQVATLIVLRGWIASDRTEGPHRNTSRRSPHAHRHP